MLEIYADNTGRERWDYGGNLRFFRTREDLVESEEEEEVRKIRKDDTLAGQQNIEKEEEEEEKEYEREEDGDEDVSLDETDGKLATMESTSQWVRGVLVI